MMFLIILRIYFMIYLLKTISSLNVFQKIQFFMFSCCFIFFIYFTGGLLLKHNRIRLRRINSPYVYFKIWIVFFFHEIIIPLNVTQSNFRHRDFHWITRFEPFWIQRNHFLKAMRYPNLPVVKTTKFGI